MRRSRLAALCVFAALCLSPELPAQTVTATIPVGSSPQAAAVNPATNKIYVANYGSNNVTVIDGATSTATAPIATGTGPIAVAVQPLTNKIYTANYGSNNVTVIDGVSNAVTSTVTVGTGPQGITVNPITNLVYVANSGSSDVTVIDGTTNNVVTTVPAGASPFNVALNPVTNKIYVANQGVAPNYAGTVTIIDGSTNTAIITVPVGTATEWVTVNPVTNKVYVSNSNSNTVSVIDGASDIVTNTISVGSPAGIAVNPVTNLIYVCERAFNGVAVIDGTSNAVVSVSVGSLPGALAVNSVTDQIYVANLGGGSVSVIAGATNAVVSTITVGAAPVTVAINPITDKVYVENSASSSNSVTVIDGATNVTSTAATGTNPLGVAVNPATNRIYVANSPVNGVTVIDGSADTVVTTVNVLSGVAVAVNPITNKIYVAGEGSFSVINGADNTFTTTAPAGSVSDIYGVAVNQVSNKVYIANNSSSNVTVIDGATDIVSATVPTGPGPTAVAVNPVTDKVYIANAGATPNFAGTVTVIDGVSNSVITTIPAGTFPNAIAVNPVTNTVYVANEGVSPNFTGSVTVINGASDTVVTTIPSGFVTYDIAVNPVTNKIYVSDGTVIDGASNAVTTVPVGVTADHVAVNPVTNKIYIANEGNGLAGSSSLTVVDGVTNSTTTVGLGTVSPWGLAVNPVTNKVYAADSQASQVTVLTEQQVRAIPLVTAITPLSGNQTTSRTPSFTFTTTSSYTPTAPPPHAVYFQVDTWQGPWTLASGANPTFTGQTAALTLGPHVLYAYAGDGQEAGIVGSGFNGQLTIGAIAAYPFTVMQVATSTALTSSPNPSDVGQAVTLTATVAVVAPGTGSPTGAVTFLDGSISLGTATLGANLQATLQLSALTAGPHSMTARYTGDANFVGSMSSALTETVNALPTVTTTSLAPGAVGTGYNQTVQATGGTTPYTWTIPTGSLPAGLTATPTLSGLMISGTPTTAATSNFTVNVRDANGFSATQALSIVIVSQLTVTTTSLPAGAVGSGYSQTLQAAGGTTPYTWTIASGSLPPGLSLSGVGVISGTPTTTGTSSFTVKVTDSTGLAATSGTLTIVVVTAVAVTTANLPAAAVGTTYNQTLQATGGTTPYTWLIASGSLPAGLSVSGAVISGTPTTAATSNFTVKVTDANGLSATQAFSILVESQLKATTTSLPAGTIGTAYSQTLQGSGGTTPYTWSIASGSLPTGLSLSGAVISGTTTTAGTSNFTVKVTDANGFSATQALSIVIVSQLTVTTTNLPAGVVGTAYSQTLQAAGGTTPYTWSIASGSLPPGLSVSGVGVISGTPTTTGSSSFMVKVTDSTGLAATSGTSTIVVVTAVTVTTANLPAGVVGTAYSQTLQASGGTTPYTWSIATGSLPAGLSLSGAQISGTPTTPATSNFTVKVTDANGLSATQALSIVVESQLNVSTTSLPAGTIGTAYSQTLQASGGTTPYTWTIASGSLPAGVSLSGAVIAGTPTTAGTSNFTVKVTDANGLSATQALSIVVESQLKVTTTSLPPGAVGTAYSQTLQATGGTAPYTWSTSGSLPAGLSLSGAVISGTPTTAATSNFTVKVTDVNGLSATKPLSILVVLPVVVTTTTLPGGTIGSVYSQTTLSASGGTGPYSWTLAAGQPLPPGLALSSSGVVSGTPTVAGTFIFSVIVADANGLTSPPSSLSIAVAAPPNAPTCQPPTVQNKGTDPRSITVTSNCNDPNTITTTIDWGDGAQPSSGTTGTHTYTLPQGVSSQSYSVVVTATDSNGLSNTVSVNVTVTAPISTSVPQGQSAQGSASPTAPLGVPTSQMTYKCTGADGPSGPQTLAFYHLSCNINGQGATASVTLTSTPIPVNISVQTNSSAMALMRESAGVKDRPEPMYAAFWLLPGLVIVTGACSRGRNGRSRKMRAHYAILLLLGLMICGLLSCGGGGSPPPPPPPPQNVTPTGIYTVTGTGTSSGGGSTSTITVGFTVTIGG